MHTDRFARGPLPEGRIEVLLVVGGKYHDFDFARLQLLGLLSEHQQLRVRVQSDYEDLSTLDSTSILVSYTCDVRPSERSQLAIRTWVEDGGRWVALHGTNSALGDAAVRPVTTPRAFAMWADTLGSQFIAHPPVEPYRVEISDPSHWLVAGIGGFETTDELYLSEYHSRSELQPLMHTTWSGTAPGFADSDWTTGDPMHLVMYLRPFGKGAVLYNTLGHCRSHYDMVPLTAFWPTIDRGTWVVDEYIEILRRSLRWARYLSE
jgi:uncharacterized protein